MGRFYISLIFALNLLLLSSTNVFAQTHKGLNDTAFKKGDIIKIPTFYIDASGQLVIKGQPNAKYPPERFDYTDSLKIVADFIKLHKNLILEIGAHGDIRNSEKFSIDFSEAKANRVYDVLIAEYGVDKNQVKYRGYGKLYPLISKKQIAKIKTKEGKEKLHAINGRFQLKVLEVK